MTDTPDPYDPCPCGSGKKYKFCCYQKARDLPLERFSAQWAEADPPPEAGLFSSLKTPALAEGMLLNSRGVRLLAAGDYEGAIELFRKAMLPGLEDFYTPSNNLALCLYITGRLEETIRVQSQSLKDSSLPNPFGLANLATFHYANGDEALSRQCLEDALKLKMPSSDACVKVCEALSRFKRHQAILTLADASPYRSNPDVCFFTGVAAANLGDRARAKMDLSRQKESHFKAEMIRRYREHLRDGTAPHTVLEDWPYLFSYEVCPYELIKAAMSEEKTTWFERRIVLDVAEVFLNETAAKPEPAIELLSGVRHPETAAFLWKITKGSFGPDRLRMAALQRLKEMGELQPKQEVEVLIKGKLTKVAMNGTNLNPDFRFGGTLPDALDKIYTKAIMDAQKPNPNWDAIGRLYMRISREAPHYYPARFNYAITLLNRGRMDEAELLVRALVEEQPAYLFARATLLQIILKKNRMAEAAELIKTATIPEETHPLAMSSWLVAQTLYFEKTGEVDMARETIQSAYRIAPESPSVKSLYKNYHEK